MKVVTKSKLKNEFGDLVAKNYDQVKKMVSDLLYEFSRSCSFNDTCNEYLENCWRCAANSQEFLTDLYILLKQFSLLQKIKNNGGDF